MRKLGTVFLFALVMCVSLVAAGKTDSSTITLTGYLINKHCLDKKHPEDDTVMCLKMPQCEGDGYGIAVEQADGTFKYFKFDTDGHAKAREIVYASTAHKLGKIKVTGTIVEGVFHVSSIKEN